MGGSGAARAVPQERSDSTGRRCRAGQTAQAGPIRDRDRLVALAQHQGDVRGVLASIDPEESAGRHEVLALEHGATVLALSMTHMRAIAESELRLRRDLVDDLLAGDDGGAFADAAALGHDLDGQHWVVVVRSDTTTTDALLRAVERAAADLGRPVLLGRRSGAVVMVIKQPNIAMTDPWHRLHGFQADRLGRPSPSA